MLRTSRHWFEESSLLLAKRKLIFFVIFSCGYEQKSCIKIQQNSSRICSVGVNQNNIYYIHSHV